MSQARYKTLLQRAVNAALTAVEIYNKPKAEYRDESFSILMLNAWELILKARLVQQNSGDMRVIFEYEYVKKKDGKKSNRRKKKLNQSGNPMTINFSTALTKVRDDPLNDVTDDLIRNLKLLHEIRNNSIHYYDGRTDLELRVHEVGSATLRNFILAIDTWFSVDIRSLNVNLNPLSLYITDKVVDAFTTGNQPKQVLNLLNLIAEFEKKSVSESAHPYSTTVKLDLNFVRNYQRGGVPVYSANNDPSAVPIKVKEDDMLKNYPWKYATLVGQMRSRYPKFKLNQDFHELRKPIEREERYCTTRYLDPQKKNRGTSKKFYSPGILSEFDKYYGK